MQGNAGLDPSPRWWQPGNQKGVSAVLKVRIETVLAAVLGAVTIMTAAWPAWIESMFGFDPDGGNGAAEWWIVAALAVVTVTAAALARRDLRAVRRRMAVGTP